MRPLPKDSQSNTIVAEETQLLERVTASLGDPEPSKNSPLDYDEAMITLRDQISEAKPEDVASLVEQMTRVSAIAQRYGKGKSLPVDPQSPYFAHLRLKEDNRCQDILIGKRGMVDRANRIHIVDWREAPISRIYYRYEEGDDYEEEFEANRPREGLVDARRNLTIAGGLLRRIGCPQGTFIRDNEDRWFDAGPQRKARLTGGEGKAKQASSLKAGSKESRLGIGSDGNFRKDKHLPEIAALIDPDQFELISRPQSGVVVLQGGAGTGKTTVALHRVAFLNYQKPRHFRPERMLVIVPSAALARYVDHVLPSLGLNGVPSVTVTQWFGRTRRRVFPVSTRAYHDDTPPNVLRFKKHPLMLDIIAEHIARQERQVAKKLASAMQGRPGEEELIQAWNRSAKTPLMVRLQQLRRSISKKTAWPVSSRHIAETTLSGIERDFADIFQDWSAMLTDQASLEALAEAKAKGSFTTRHIREVCRWAAQQSEELEAGGRPNQALIESRKFERELATDEASTRDVPPVGRLDPIDDALLLCLFAMKWGELRTPNGSAIAYTHIVADEAQDIAATELKVLSLALDEGQSMTLAGDPVQRIVFDNEFHDWETWLKRLELPADAAVTLRLGYRSTAEVMALAQTVAGELVRYEAPSPQRAGAMVELFSFAGHGEAVAFIADALRSLRNREPQASIALIARYQTQAQTYAEGLKKAEVADVRLVLDFDFSFRAGIEVTTVAQVKGLEFDYVIVLDATSASYPESTQSRHLLHIAATRAAHQLWLIAIGSPSPLLPKPLVHAAAHWES